MGKAWIFQGGWDGHEPALTSARFKAMLEKHGYEATIFDTLDPWARAWVWPAVTAACAIPSDRTPSGSSSPAVSGSPIPAETA